MIRITFLGTAAARPTVGRNVTALAVQREGDLFLFDCGEGTQRQMMRYQSGFDVRAIFVTHLHADHILGLPGLLRTMALQGRTEALHVYGPPKSRRTLEEVMRLGVERLPFPVPVVELEPGAHVQYDEFQIHAVPADHGVTAVGWALLEEDRLGRFDVDAARAAGVPEGPMFGRLHRGETIEVDGRVFDPSEFVGPSRPGRKVVFTGDTRPTEGVQAAARGADLLVHEATFLDEERDRAEETRHSTAAGAAELAARAEVRQLVLTHVSARYSDAPDRLEEEARAIFPDVRVARDGLVVEVPFREDA